VEEAMVKSAPMRDHSIVIKPRRRTGAGAVVLLIVLLSASLAVLGIGFFAPAKLAMVQERTIAVFHGGVAGIEEHTFVDACVESGDAEGPQAVTRTIRTTVFLDGTSLSVTFSSTPTPTNSRCGG
jgi:hypothetical protein